MFAATLALVVNPQHACADLFHYSNLLIGQRAIGLAGAFTALSDDTSGLHYNPAGIALQTSSELSGSINSFYLKKNTFERVFGEKQFTESARGNVSSFFGLSKKISPPVLGNISIGLAFINPDASLINENVLIENEPDPNVIRYHRAANIRSGSSQIIAGAGKKFGKQSAFGCAGSYLEVDELEQTYQDVVQGPFISKSLPSTQIYSTLGQNLRTHLVIRGGGLRCGFRTGFDNGFKLGVSYQRTEIVYQNFEYDFVINKVYNDGEGKIVAIDGSAEVLLNGKIQREANRTQSQSFISLWPDELRIGIAFQPHRSLTLTADTVRYGPGDGNTVRVKRGEVINFAFGSELLLANTLFLRAGFFTNNDATPSRDLSSPEQRKEYMDYRGIAVSTGLKLRIGDYGIHYVEQRGRGMAEKVAGKRNNSNGRLQVVSISATQSFQ